MTKLNQENPTAQEQPTTKKPKHKPDVLESILTGGITGAIEVMVNHPLWSIKTQIQSGHPITLAPKVIYAGIIPNAASQIVNTAVIVGLNRLNENYVFNQTTSSSLSQNVLSSFTAGAGSALISCPTEMVMTHQMKSGQSFFSSAKNLVNAHGGAVIYSGLMATILREGLFATFFLAVMPELKKQILPYCTNEHTASVVAGLITGIGATIASHGFDTIKTIQQTGIGSKGFLQTACHLYASKGLPGFFQGSIPRGTRVVSAITLMGIVKEKIESTCFAQEEPEYKIPQKM